MYVYTRCTPRCAYIGGTINVLYLYIYIYIYIYIHVFLHTFSKLHCAEGFLLSSTNPEAMKQKVLRLLNDTDSNCLLCHHCTQMQLPAFQYSIVQYEFSLEPQPKPLALEG